MSACGGWSELSVEDFASAIFAAPVWQRLYLCGGAATALEGIPQLLDVVSTRGRGKAVVGPTELSTGRHWLTSADLSSRRCAAFRGFLYLLHHKRCLGALTANPAELNTEQKRKVIIEYKFGERRVQRAWSAEKMSSYAPSDSLLVQSFIDGVEFGHDSLLITTDRTVMEQYATMVSIFSRAYFAAVLGETVFKDVQIDSVVATPELKRLGFRTCPNITNLRKSAAFELLPKNPWDVHFHCWLFEPVTTGVRLLPMSFRGERPMHLMLSNRRTLGGRNARLPRDMNVHFSWNSNGEPALTFAVEDRIKPGDTDCPLIALHEHDTVSIAELISAQNFSDPVHFPWHDEANSNTS